MLVSCPLAREEILPSTRCHENTLNVAMGDVVKQVNVTLFDTSTIELFGAATTSKVFINHTVHTNVNV